MTTPLLYHIPYSPWSHQARAALAWHGVSVELAPFVPMVSMAGLRWRARRPFGRLTVPCLIAAEAGGGRTVLTDSVLIARWAEAQAAARPEARPPLFPTQHAATIEHWSARAQGAMAAGRALTTAAVTADRLALRASVPAPLRRPAALADALGSLGVIYLRRKYRFGSSGLEAHAGALRAFLVALRTALFDGPHPPRRWLCDRPEDGPELGADAETAPTFADLTAACALHFVDPPADLPLEPVARPHFGRPHLAAEFADVLVWRDRVLRAFPLG